jgi:hypothetical protein
MGQAKDRLLRLVRESGRAARDRGEPREAPSPREFKMTLPAAATSLAALRRVWIEGWDEGGRRT